jgi:hypothetical protein
MAAFGGEFRLTTFTIYHFSTNTTTLFFLSILQNSRCNTHEHEQHSLQPLAAFCNGAECEAMARMQLTTPIAASPESRGLAETHGDDEKVFKVSETLKGMCSLFVVAAKSLSPLCRVTKLPSIISTLLPTITSKALKISRDTSREDAPSSLQVAEHADYCGSVDNIPHPSSC